MVGQASDDLRHPMVVAFPTGPAGALSTKVLKSRSSFFVNMDGRKDVSSSSRFSGCFQVCASLCSGSFIITPYIPGCMESLGLRDHDPAPAPPPLSRGCKSWSYIVIDQMKILFLLAEVFPNET